MAFRTKTAPTRLVLRSALLCNSICVTTNSCDVRVQNTPRLNACNHLAFSVPAETAELPLAALWLFGCDSDTSTHKHMPPEGVPTTAASVQAPASCCCHVTQAAVYLEHLIVTSATLQSPDLAAALHMLMAH